MPINVQAAVATGDGKFIIDTITIDEPKSDEVLVKMKAAGLCHTDYDSLTWGKPIVMGHEGAGVVEKVGNGNLEFEAGLRRRQPPSPIERNVRGGHEIGNVL